MPCLFPLERDLPDLIVNPPRPGRLEPHRLKRRGKKSVLLNQPDLNCVSARKHRNLRLA
jgi:hypothetical protein